MKKVFFSLTTFIFCSTICFAQKDTLRGEAAAKLTKDIFKQNKIDSSKFLAEVANEACKCIDSITLIGKDTKEITAEISKCIDGQVTVYQLEKQLLQSLMSTGNNKIIINDNKNSREYKGNYFEIERWLNDSCASIRIAAAANNKEVENSMSKNEVALSYFNKGSGFFEKDNYKEALPLFEQAVEQDPKFAFAWDNLGICKRRLGDLDGALIAYNKSLELDPKGRTPLQNIAIVYELKKDYDKALESYQKMAKVYPDDPEPLYGAGRMYSYKDDIEKALDYMCKAYNAYIALNSPYRTDAEKIINEFYRKLKDQGKEERFREILKANNISTK